MEIVKKIPLRKFLFKRLKNIKTFVEIKLM